MWWAFSWSSPLWGAGINIVLTFVIGFFKISKGKEEFLSSLLFASILFFAIFIQIWQLKRVLPNQLKRFSFNDKADESTIF
ncbi:hypothetical protein A9266_04135 [Vibrio tasmaniensis]|nr:hypothetical protein A9266_04135 [Vibrio tasmaniensis]